MMVDDGDNDGDNDGDGDVDPGTATVRPTVAAVFDVVAATATAIRTGLHDRHGATVGEENPSGETQLAADVHADRLLADRLLGIEGVTAYASEERETVVYAPPEADAAVDADVDPGVETAGVSVTVDPLDGSSNLASNNPMGTIVGVYKTDATLPAPGRSLIAAGYVLYGPTTTLTIAAGPPGEAEVTVEAVVDGDRRPVDDDVALPDSPTVYGFGGRVVDWPPAFVDYVREIEAAGDLKLRYGGAMVADVNQVLTYSGVFGYPGLRDRPEGKLRLAFEAAPMAHVIETADGRSSNGERSLLAVTPDGLHDRTPVFLGSTELIDRLETALD